jgi:hypothetical protein
MTLTSRATNRTIWRATRQMQRKAAAWPRDAGADQSRMRRWWKAHRPDGDNVMDPASPDDFAVPGNPFIPSKSRRIDFTDGATVDPAAATATATSSPQKPVTSQTTTQADATATATSSTNGTQGQTGTVYKVTQVNIHN